ncbi:MAG: methyltransferase domain-containing protein [Candidatus Paceibacterota bacterium]|jgi:ubiquinone/menaquinone biosynthesis C-methylase UbiE
MTKENKKESLFTFGLNNDAGRDAWLKKILTAIPAGSRILDAGAGERRFEKYCTHLKYVSQDFGGYDGVGDSVGLQTGVWNQKGLDIVSDITNIPEPDGSFDAILCSEVFEHIKNPVEAIKEFSRLLKKGGMLIVTAPFASGTHFAPYHFATGFNKYFYEANLHDNGFEIAEMERNGNFFEFLAQEVRRTPFMVKTYSKKIVLPFVYVAAILFLATIRLAYIFDKQSSEFMCYGYFVVARKR